MDWFWKKRFEIIKDLARLGWARLGYARLCVAGQGVDLSSQRTNLN
jgi:hypothetical protein